MRHSMGLAPPQAGMAASEVPQMLTQTGLSVIGGRLGAALGRAVPAHHTVGDPVVSPGDVCLRRDCGGPSAPSHTAARASICGAGRRQGCLLSGQSCHPSASKHRMGRWCRQIVCKARSQRRAESGPHPSGTPLPLGVRRAPLEARLGSRGTRSSRVADRPPSAVWTGQPIWRRAIGSARVRRVRNGTRRGSAGGGSCQRSRRL